MEQVAPSIGFFLGMLVAAAVWGAIIYSVVKLLRRLGYSAWWAWMICFWPAGLWMLAHADWPVLRGQRNA